MINNKKSMVSIIIPVYNAEKYIANCYHSLKIQSYKNLELVFVDDCSTDRSYEILNQISINDSRVVLLKMPKNSGVSAARNLGLDKCKGDLIGFCDADDTYEENMVLNMVSIMVKENADISCCALKRVNVNGVTKEVIWQAPKGLVLSSEEALKNWLIGRYIGNSIYTKISKRELWNQVRFPEGEIFEEAYVIPQIFCKAPKIVHTGTIEYNYFIREGSYTQSVLDESCLAVYRREKYIQKLILEKHPSLKDAYDCFVVRMNTANMRKALLCAKDVDNILMEEVKKQYCSSKKNALTNQYLSKKEKMEQILVILLLEVVKHKLKMSVKRVLRR